MSSSLSKVLLSNEKVTDVHYKDLESQERDDHANERKELIEMILESIANVPVAMKQIHTNEKLKAAIREEMGENHTVCRYFGSDTMNEMIQGSKLLEISTLPVDRKQQQNSTSNNLSPIQQSIENHTSQSPTKGISSLDLFNDTSSKELLNSTSKDMNEVNSSSSKCSSYDSAYERDLADAVDQLCSSEEILSEQLKHLQSPSIKSCSTASINTQTRLLDIRRVSSASGYSAIRSSSASPQSSISMHFGTSPGAYSQDDEPVSAVWPRQPNEFVFTQEDENHGTDANDEMYNELEISQNYDENYGLDTPYYHDENDETDENTFEKMEMIFGINRNGEEEENYNDVTDTEYDHAELEVVPLRIYREKHRTGFEPCQNWQPRVGHIVGKRYKVELVLGEAVFSRTYKCLDLATHQLVCLKVIKNNKEYFDQAIDEIRVLRYMDENCDVDENHIVKLLDYFYFREHLILVTELLHDNLYELSKVHLKRGVLNFFSMSRLKKITRDILEALSLIHSLELIHCDLKPENIVIRSFSPCEIKVIDFGSACFLTDDLTSYVQSRSYRAPEVILGLHYDEKIDLWSLGCILAELYTGKVLFENDSELSLLDRICSTIGPIPQNLLDSNSVTVFDETKAENYRRYILEEMKILPTDTTLEKRIETNDTSFLSFLRSLLTIDPNHRLSAIEAMRHEWLQHEE